MLVGGDKRIGSSKATEPALRKEELEEKEEKKDGKKNKSKLSKEKILKKPPAKIKNFDMGNNSSSSSSGSSGSDTDSD